MTDTVSVLDAEALVREAVEADPDGRTAWRDLTRRAVRQRDIGDEAGFAALVAAMKERRVRFSPPRMFEEMYRASDQNPFLLVAHEKHGKPTWVIRSADDFAASHIGLLSRRLGEDFLYERADHRVPDPPSPLAQAGLSALIGHRLPALPWPDGDGDPGDFWKGEGNPWREALREFGGLMGGPGCGDVAAWMVLGGADRGEVLASDRATFLAALWLSGRDAEHWGPNIRAALEASAHPALRRAGESWFPASAADEARGIVALSRRGGGEFRRAGRLAAEFLRSRRDHQYERVEIVLPEPIPSPSVPDTPRPVGAAP